jgi:competence protein ComFC
MSVFEIAIGWLAPPACVNCGDEGVALCLDCSDLLSAYGEHCWLCNALSPGCKTCDKCRRTNTPKHVWIVANYDEKSSGLVRLYKFGHQRAASEPIAQLMINAFLKYGNWNEIKAKNYIIVPVPTATSRIRQRGFGHAELLAEKIAIKLRLRKVNALRRIGQSRQVGSNRQDRLIQLEQSFSVKNTKQIYNQNILLIDDVTTTGGTIQSVTKALKLAGAKQVDALLFAKRL